MRLAKILCSFCAKSQMTQASILSPLAVKIRNFQSSLQLISLQFYQESVSLRGGAKPLSKCDVQFYETNQNGTE